MHFLRSRLPNFLQFWGQEDAGADADALELAARLGTPQAIARARRVYGFQLSVTEVLAIKAALDAQGPCRFLVFGVGHDAPLWHRLNRGGETCFLEHHDGWRAQLQARFPELRIERVAYHTERRKAAEYLEDPQQMRGDFPRAVTDKRWDVILVDGPNGWRAKAPGRMLSIYLASQWVARPGDVFIHDSERSVERTWSARFLGDAHEKTEIKGRRGHMRHYQLPRLAATEVEKEKMAASCGLGQA